MVDSADLRAGRGRRHPLSDVVSWTVLVEVPAVPALLPRGWTSWTPVAEPVGPTHALPGRGPGKHPGRSLARQLPSPTPPAVVRGVRDAGHLTKSSAADCHSSTTALWWPGPVGRHLPVGRPERTPPSRPPGEPGTHRSTGVNPAPGRTSGTGRATSRPNPSANPVGGRRKNGEPPDGVPLPCPTPPAAHPGAHPHLTPRGRPQRTPRGPTGSRAPALDRHLAASPGAPRRPCPAASPPPADPAAPCARVAPLRPHPRRTRDP